MLKSLEMLITLYSSYNLAQASKFKDKLLIFGYMNLPTYISDQNNNLDLKQSTFITLYIQYFAKHDVIGTIKLCSMHSLFVLSNTIQNIILMENIDW